MDRARDEAASFEDLAATVQKRAELVLELAERALAEAEHAAKGSRTAELRLWEAGMHKKSAELLEQTASLYLRRATDLKAASEPARIAGAASAPRRSYTADLESIATQRAQLVAHRERLAMEREQLVSDLQWALHKRQGLDDQLPPEPERAE